MGGALLIGVFLEWCGCRCGVSVSRSGFSFFVVGGVELSFAWVSYEVLLRTSPLPAAPVQIVEGGTEVPEIDLLLSLDFLAVG